MRIRNQTDFAAGLLYLAVGACAAYIASGYTMGTAADMGTGFFPFWLGVLLAGIGVAVCASSLRNGASRETLASWEWRPLAWVSLAIAIFALIFDAAGMVLSIFALVLISSQASRELRWKGAIAIALLLNAISYFAFAWLLNMPLRIWPSL